MLRHVDQKCDDIAGKPCPAPPHVEYGQYEKRVYVFEETVTCTCLNGYANGPNSKATKNKCLGSHQKKIEK